MDDGALGGLPWLALAFVRGRPLTAYADEHSLGVEGRLGLFLQVCDAVAYAHARLVVHRDLKPSNVLAGTDDVGRPHATVLDFGIAKLLDEDENALETRTGERALTPAYAAPEQLRGEPVTTATDVYALGVLLYELLAGRRPYELAGQTAAEAERIVTAQEPTPMSRAAGVPAARAARLRGDLDVIVQRAMAKEPVRRYATADALAADLRRHLEGLPVDARAPTAAYRVRKFAGRHRAGVAAAAVAVLALVIGFGVAVQQAAEARHAAADAERAAARAEATQGFLLGMLAAADPDADGRDVRVADLLDRAAATLDSTLAGQPILRADARQRLGETYRGLGLFPEARTQFADAVALHTRLSGPDAAATAASRRWLGMILSDLAEYDAADAALAQSLAGTRAAYGEHSAEAAQVLAEIGRLRYMQGDAVGSAAAHRAVLTIEQATLPPGDRELITTLGNLAVALAEIDSMDASIELHERQLRLLRALDPPDPGNLGNALANLGAAYVQQDRYEEAVAAQTEAVALLRPLLGDDHPDLAFGLNNLGSTLVQAGRPAEAVPLLRESDAIVQAAMGERHPVRGFPLVGLAQALRELGRPGEAREAALLAHQLFTDGFGPDHPALARATQTLETLGGL